VLIKRFDALAKHRIKPAHNVRIAHSVRRFRSDSI